MRLPEAIRRNRATIVCGIAVAALVVALWVTLGTHGSAGALVALVHDGDGQTHELPLGRDAQLSVTTSLGTNVICVKNGAVRMLDADCPNKNCLQMGPLTEPGPQIICLPHQLWVEVVPAGSEGGEMDVTRTDDTVDLVAR